MKPLITILVVSFIGLFSCGILSFVADIFRKKWYYMKVKDVLGFLLLTFTLVLVLAFAGIVIIWLLNYFNK